MKNLISESLPKSSIYFNVFEKKHDNVRTFSNILTQVREAFFTENKKQKDKVYFTYENDKLTYIYQMNTKGTMKWKATINGKLVEESISEAAGYIIVCKNNNEKLYKKIYFNNSHVWQKTEYFDGYHDVPVFYFLPWMNDSRAAIAKYDSESSIPEIFFSLKMPADEEMVQKLLDETGVLIYAHTSSGRSYFGNEEEEEKWNSLLKQKTSSNKQPAETKEKVKEIKYIEMKGSKKTNNNLFKNLAVLGNPKHKETTELSKNNTSNQPAILEKTNNNTANKAEPRKNESNTNTKKTDDEHNIDNPVSEFLSDRLEIDDLLKGLNVNLDNFNIEKVLSSNTETTSKVNNDDDIKDSNKSVSKKSINISQKEKGVYYGELNKNGNRDGYGKTQTSDGVTLYDGYYKDDKKHGFGAAYYKTGKIYYVGNWEDDIQNGIGIDVRPMDGYITLAEYEKGKKKTIIAKVDNEGKLISANTNRGDDNIALDVEKTTGNLFISGINTKETSTILNSRGLPVYYGEIKNGKKDGTGILYNEDGSVLYKGDFLKDDFNGKGSLYTADGLVISGDFSSGMVSGKAIKSTLGGEPIYSGEWEKNNFHGKGKLFTSKGYCYEGVFKNGNPIGEFKLIDTQGNTVYKGEMKDGLKDGHGISFDSNGNKQYEGEWTNDKQSGYGEIFANGKLIYSGNFANNAYNGLGISYDESGNRVYNGIWKDGQYDGEGVLFKDNKPYLVGSFSENLLSGRANIIENDIVVKECLFEGGACVYQREYSPSGDSLVFEGNIKDNKKEGMGCLFNEFGEKQFEGIFKNDEQYKSMKINYRQLEKLPVNQELKDTEYEKYRKQKEFAVELPLNDAIYSGFLKDGKPSGKGTMLYTDHTYTGCFENGKPFGKGVLYFDNGTEIKGEFLKKKTEDSSEVKFSSVIYYINK